MFKRALVILMAASGVVAETPANPVRSAPTRPATVIDQPKPAPVQKTETKTAAPRVPATPIGYVDVAEWAKRHGLEVSWVEPQKRLLLKNASVGMEIDAGSREMRVNGVRVLLGDPSRLVDGELRISRVDAERQLPGLLNPAVGGPREIRTIAIDAGHGGTDTGTTNAALGLQEKVFSLDVAKRLRTLLESAGYRVVMTRETDVYVALGGRAIIANQAKADLFVTVHFNAVVTKTQVTKGVEVFTFAPQFQRSTDAWSPGKADDTESLPAPVNRFDTQNVAFAHAIHRALLAKLKTDDRGQKIAHWTVLRALNCPGVLVESGFLSNEAEGKKIATPEYRQQIAEAIADGVKNYSAAIAEAKP